MIGNVFYDRAAGAVVVPNDASTWHRSADWFRDEVVTVFEQVARHRPGAITASIDEPVDRGATHSTMGLIRAGEQTAGRDVGGAKALAAQLPSPLESPYATREFVVADADYAWNSQIDDAGLAQALGLWERADSAPALTWWSHIVTDAGHHAGGPRSPIAIASLIDADRRLGVFLDHLEAIGLLDETTVLLTADHGFEGADPGCTGDWLPALAAAGVAVQDHGPGFLYLGAP